MPPSERDGPDYQERAGAEGQTRGRKEDSDTEDRRKECLSAGGNEPGGDSEFRLRAASAGRLPVYRLEAAARAEGEPGVMTGDRQRNPAGTMADGKDIGDDFGRG